MPKKVFKSDMSVNGIDSLIRELQKDEDDLPNKCKKLVSMLAEEGITVGKQNVGGFGKYITFSMKTNPIKDGCKAIMLASENGKIISSWKTKDGIKTADVSPLLMAEFGSGFGAENPMKIE